ncbi:MAG: hypothetical protein COT24_01920 [Candidatus Kerfeldbacteria bacterium CG08_land_8_20_14_0_20_40_16]|uniref:Uncharacterized protein n=1 Tax=Candidatus Kerfeldbacteria bacterium CG08_land_8_20_14_0_20_40_16 TaxID=2014244 RepID=A0A2H0YW59_9BACT|nr:MAG: hypothetical protein COT24_01920 [Candidatus Kerfeldbacteria bacterium CG08_land_8_20_14_0_20_40_16]
MNDNCFFFKVNFDLSNSPNEPIIKPLILNKLYNIEKYALVTFSIQPFKFLEQFENTVFKIQELITSSEEIKKHFDKTITVDNWMKVISVV